MGWQERGAFEVVPLQSPRRSAAGGVGLISPLLALSAQVEELDPAGGERRKGGKEGVEKEKHLHHSPFPFLSLSLFLPQPVT